MKKFFLLLILFFFNIFVISADNKIKVKLDKCIDGDTARFIINDEVKTVRFLSINTPEIAHDGTIDEYYGDEASIYTCTSLREANEITLEFDPNSDKTDKYDRLLAWVYVDDVLLQESLVRNGYASVKYVYDDYLYSDKLVELENIAKSEHIGIWDNSVSNDGYSYIYIVILVGVFLLFTFYYLKR